MRMKQILAAVLCAVSLGTAVLPVSAAQAPTQKSGKTEDGGVSYTLYYPKVYGYINATIDVLNQGWSGDGICRTIDVELPVVASGDPFVLKLTGGMTGSRCPDCDTSCIHVFFGNLEYSINGYDATRPDTFEWRTHSPATPGKTANTIEIDYEADSVGLRELNDFTMDPSDHFFYAPGHPYYDPDSRNYGDGVFPLDVGYYLRLPEETIAKMDFSRDYTSADLSDLLKGNVPAADATYGQSSVKIKGYTIDEDYQGKMLIEVTNNGKAPDKGDLFYVTYCKFIQGSELIDAGSYVPYNLILQIPYEVPAGETKTLAIPVGFLPNYDEALTGDQIANGWQDMENVESSRTVLAQAETPEEAAELAAFFKGAHDYWEMGLTYEPDADGVIILAKPMSNVRRAEYLDQKLSAFTSQF